MRCYASQVDKVQSAYGIIGALIFISFFIFIGSCCALPCRNVQTPVPQQQGPSKEQDWSNPIRLWHAKFHLFTIIWVAILFYLLEGVHASMYNLLTVYMVTGWGKIIKQEVGVYVTVVYWSSVAASRFVFAGFNPKFKYSKVITVCTASSLVSAALLVVFGAISMPWFWLGICLFGINFGPLIPMVYSWLDQKLPLAPWLTSLMLIFAELGRMSVPVVISRSMQSHQPRDLLIAVLVIMLFAGLFLVLSRKVASKASEMAAMVELSKHMNGEAEFNVQTNDRELDLDFDGDDLLYDNDRVYFERTREFQGRPINSDPRRVGGDNHDGAFARYSMRQQQPN